MYDDYMNNKYMLFSVASEPLMRANQLLANE